MDKRRQIMALVNKGRCGHCGVVGQVCSQVPYPNVVLEVWCRACGSSAVVRMKGKHAAARIAAHACWLLKKHYVESVTKELMR